MRDQVAGFRESSKGSALMSKKEEKGQGEGRRGDWRCTQSLQNPLIKEYTLNHIRDPIII